MTSRDFVTSVNEYAVRFRDVIQDVTKLLGPRIHGVEVTQAIQHYRSASHLNDPADRGDDNSIRLVANKVAWVPVYVRPGLIASGTTTARRDPTRLPDPR